VARVGAAQRERAGRRRPRSRPHRRRRTADVYPTADTAPHPPQPCPAAMTPVPPTTPQPAQRSTTPAPPPHQHPQPEMPSPTQPRTRYPPQPPALGAPRPRRPEQHCHQAHPTRVVRDQHQQPPDSLTHYPALSTPQPLPPHTPRPTPPTLAHNPHPAHHTGHTHTPTTGPQPPHIRYKAEHTNSSGHAAQPSHPGELTGTQKPRDLQPTSQNQPHPKDSEPFRVADCHGV
jgi:hypothetical protein